MNEIVGVLSRFRDIPNQIKINNKIIKDIEEQHYNALKSVQMDGLPKGSGKVSSLVEQAALNIPDGVKRALEKLEIENKRLNDLYEEITKELSKLEYREKKIIYEFYIYEYKWEKIARGFYSVRQCKNIRNGALRKLRDLFEENEVINPLLKIA